MKKDLTNMLEDNLNDQEIKELAQKDLNEQLKKKIMKINWNYSCYQKMMMTIKMHQK